MSWANDPAFTPPAEQEALEEQTGQLVLLVARFLRHTRIHADAVPPDIQALLHDNGLGPRHLSVLIGLAVGGPAPVGHLAERVALAPATTSLLVNQLRRADLVTRHTDSLDRRRALIGIRDDLRPRVAALAEQRLRPLRATLARLSPQERAHFLRGWQLLVDLHDQEAARRSDPSPAPGKEPQ